MLLNRLAENKVPTEPPLTVHRYGDGERRRRRGEQDAAEEREGKEEGEEAAVDSDNTTVVVSYSNKMNPKVSLQFPLH